MRRFLWVPVLAAFLLAGCSPGPKPSSAPTPTASAPTAPRLPELQPEWSAPLDVLPTVVMGQRVIVADEGYFPDSDGVSVVGLSTADGTQVWRLGGAQNPIPACGPLSHNDAGLLLVGLANPAGRCNQLAVVDTANGRILWRQPWTGSFADNAWLTNRTVAVLDDTCGPLLRYSARDGSPLPQLPQFQADASETCQDSWASAGTRAVQMDTHTGSEWNAEGPAESTSHYEVYDVDSGDRLWRTRKQDWTFGTSFTVSMTDPLVLESDGTSRAYGPQGEVLEAFDLEVEPVEELSRRDGLLIALDSNLEPIAIDTKTGALSWRFDAADGEEALGVAGASLVTASATEQGTDRLIARSIADPSQSTTLGVIPGGQQEGVVLSGRLYSVSYDGQLRAFEIPPRG